MVQRWVPGDLVSFILFFVLVQFWTLGDGQFVGPTGDAVSTMCWMQQCENVTDQEKPLQVKISGFISKIFD